MQKSLSRYWLLIGVAALAIAGLFSLVLVVARTPALADLPLAARLFHEALVVHVDLSVLVWFLSIACLLWSMQAAGRRQPVPYLEEAAQLCFALGTLAIAVCPLDPRGEALMSNYIPVIHSPVFFMGLALLLCGVSLMLLRLFSCGTCGSVFSKPITFAVLTSGIIAYFAIVEWVRSYAQMPRGIDGAPYYELLFWGGGHVLQFAHVQIGMVCWLLIAARLKPDFRLPDWLLHALFAIGLVAAVAAFIIHKLYLNDVTSAAYCDFYTELMVCANGIAPMLLALFLLVLLWRMRGARKREERALWSGLLMSVLLFLYGGILGEAIRGQNVVIPAHYHGSIVGLTLAFMGVAYLLLPRFGYRDPAGWRLAYWQPYMYGFGQLLHVSGLAWSGGYGVLRKTPGGLDGVPLNVKIAMGIMGLGGTLAIVGGFMFVVVVGKAVFMKSNAAMPAIQ